MKNIKSIAWNSTIRILGLLVVALFLTNNIKAQSTVKDGYTNSWFTLLNRFQLNKNWSVSNEIHNRFGEFLQTQGQFLFRPSIDYSLNEHVEFALGYSFIHVSPYKPYSLPIAKNENNFWEQVILKNSVGKVKFLHRFRQENRWIDHITTSNGESKINGRDYANRFRYRFVLNVDLLKIKDSEQSIFFAAFDELWFAQNDHLLPTDFARNWLYLGLGYKFNQSTNLQAGYMHQYDKVGINSFISTPILQVTLVKNFSFVHDN
ncbi:MAG: DUF2490 domain-containing protein [Flavobacteriales bacterium]|nr:DUF2490 domain-containing protein [Flavobacteriales bacterium]